MALLATTSPADPPLGNSGRRVAETERRRSWLRLDDDGHAPRSGGCVGATACGVRWFDRWSQDIRFAGKT